MSTTLVGSAIASIQVEFTFQKMTMGETELCMWGGAMSVTGLIAIFD